MDRLPKDLGATGTDRRQRQRSVISLVGELLRSDCVLGEKMEISLNITFPRIPCELLTLDVMDVSGEVQTGVVHGVNKVRLSPIDEGGLVLDTTALRLHADIDVATHLDPDYCGSCYSAPAPSNAIKSGCCNTCDEVREAYATNSWAFGRVKVSSSANEKDMPSVWTPKGKRVAESKVLFE